MEGLQEQIQGQQTQRQKEIDENNAVRQKIQDVIAQYKTKEEDYRKQMESQR